MKKCIDVVLGSQKEFVITEAQTHSPGCSVPLFKSQVQRQLGYLGDHM